MQLYSFRLNGGSRIDVKASSPEAGYNKLKAIPLFETWITKYYYATYKDNFELQLSEHKIKEHEKQ